MLETTQISEAAECDFDCTLQQHLNAIEKRDYPAFEKTLTKGKNLTLILPNGHFSESAEQFRAMMKEWFADQSWKLQYRLVSKQKSVDMASALLLVSYDEKDEHGKLHHLDYYLNLIFKKEGSHWALVHDQNTLIAKR